MTSGRIAVVALAAMLPALPGQQTPQVFRAATDLVSVDVAVRSGRSLVKGLTSADFQLLDNGVEQRIEAVSVDAVPVDLTLVLDTSGSTALVIDRFKSDTRVIASILRPDDRVRLITVSTAVTEVFPMQPATNRLPTEGIRAGGGTSIHDGVLLALVRRPVSNRRHLVVVFTDGDDTSSLTSASTLATLAGRSDGVVYLVMSEVAGQTEDAHRELAAALREVTDATGGDLRPLSAGGDAVDAFKRAFADFRQSYVLRYTLNGVVRDGWHTVDVKVSRPGNYDLRAKKGYVGG